LSASCMTPSTSPGSEPNCCAMAASACMRGMGVVGVESQSRPPILSPLIAIISRSALVQSSPDQIRLTLVKDRQHTSAELPRAWGSLSLRPCFISLKISFKWPLTCGAETKTDI
jgi:hypothetical protein